MQPEGKLLCGDSHADGHISAESFARPGHSCHMLLSEAASAIRLAATAVRSSLGGAELHAERCALIEDTDAAAQPGVPSPPAHRNPVLSRTNTQHTPARLDAYRCHHLATRALPSQTSSGGRVDAHACAAATDNSVDVQPGMREFSEWRTTPPPPRSSRASSQPETQRFVRRVAAVEQPSRRGSHAPRADASVATAPSGSTPASGRGTASTACCSFAGQDADDAMELASVGEWAGNARHPAGTSGAQAKGISSVRASNGSRRTSGNRAANGCRGSARAPAREPAGADQRLRGKHQPRQHVRSAAGVSTEAGIPPAPAQMCSMRPTEFASKDQLCLADSTQHANGSATLTAAAHHNNGNDEIKGGAGAVAVARSACGCFEYFHRLSTSFGPRFVLMVFISGGLSKGVGRALVTFASQYLYTDKPPHGFGLTASRVAAVDALVHSPWVVKALYGIVSDTTPIFGFHRTSYVVIGGAVGVLAFFSLAVMPLTVPLVSCAGLLLVHFSFALTDVMMDAIIADRTRTHPRHATDLQVLTMGSLCVCSMAASLVKGSILEAAGTRSLFWIGSMVSMTVVPPAIFGWLGEARVPPDRSGSTFGSAVRGDHAGADIFKLAMALSILALGLAATTVALPSSSWLPPVLSVPVSILVCTACWRFEQHISPQLARASMYAFLKNALQPTLVVMYKWYKATEENCNPAKPILGLHPLPCFSPQFVGWLDVLAQGAFLIALGLYNRFLSAWQYRSIFTTAQLTLVAVNLLDLVWVCRLNLQFGLPDELFALGNELLQPLVDDFSLIPLFVLVAKLCPLEAQGTAFALNMGLLWLGRNVGGYLGMGMLTFLGGVEPPLFENIKPLVFLRSLTRALPLLLIPLLLPKGSPQDDAESLASSGSHASKMRAVEANVGHLSKQHEVIEAFSQLGVWI